MQFTQCDPEKLTAVSKNSCVIRCQINPPGPINPEKAPRLSNAMSTEVKSERRKRLSEENFLGKSEQNQG